MSFNNILPQALLQEGAHFYSIHHSAVTSALPAWAIACLSAKAIIEA
jgi:hypothetical protein